MGHAVEALIVADAAVHLARTTLEHTRPILLGQGLHLIPITDQAFDALRLRFPDAESAPHPEFWKLSGPIVFVAQQLSLFGPVAYLETDYFGGAGSQSAIVWNQAKVAMPPTRASGGPINAALRLLRVKPGLVQDEFDAMGLGRHRSNDGWLEGSP